MSEIAFTEQLDDRPRETLAPPLFPGKYLSIISLKRNGAGVATPVWFVQQGGRLLVQTEADSGKVKRIRHNPQVLIAPCTATGRLLADPVPARAELLPAVEVARVERLLARKYRIDPAGDQAHPVAPDVAAAGPASSQAGHLSHRPDMTSDADLVRRDTAGVVTGLPLVLLRSEGVALLATAAVLYGRYGRSWWLFLALLPVPDLGLLGQLWSKRVGAVAYDLTHTYVPPAVLGLVGVVAESGLAVALALVWFAHIGMDRALGLGLQYPDGSGCTHLRGTVRRDGQ